MSMWQGEVLVMSINVFTMAVRGQWRFGRGLQLIVVFYSHFPGCSKGVPIQVQHRRRCRQKIYQGNYLRHNQKCALNYLVDAP